MSMANYYQAVALIQKLVSATFCQPSMALTLKHRVANILSSLSLPTRATIPNLMVSPSPILPKEAINITQTTIWLDNLRSKVNTNSPALCMEQIPSLPTMCMASNSQNRHGPTRYHQNNKWQISKGRFNLFPPMIPKVLLQTLGLGDTPKVCMIRPQHVPYP